MMLVFVLLFAIASGGLVWLALRLDASLERRLGWVLLPGAGTVMAWPLTTATEADRFRLLMSGYFVALLMLIYGAVHLFKALRARFGGRQ